MGSRGPQPQPTALKILNGNPGKRPLNRNAPRPKNKPTMPAGMSEPAKAVWVEVIRDYGATGVLTGLDSHILRGYCEAVVRYEHGAALLEASGPLVMGARKGELVKSPMHQVVRDDADLMIRFADRLGCTPSARNALAAVKEEDTGDALDRWQAGG